MPQAVTFYQATYKQQQEARPPAPFSARAAKRLESELSESDRIQAQRAVA
ncbi:MAG TPA: hypothetical protein VE153_17810 [Myxococcus sp.]|jgi:hypothetical protein|nr:hypothetical protein [Myxococcus sp.]